MYRREVDPMIKTKPNTKDFLESVAAYAKHTRRAMLGVTVHFGTSGQINSEGCRVSEAHNSVYGRFMPRWFLIESAPDLLIQDVRFGACSQFAGQEPVPAAMFAMDEALSILDSPDSPAWDRFKLSPSDNEPLDGRHGVTVSVHLAETVRRKEDRIVRCVLLGDEVRFRNIGGLIQGILSAVAMTARGPIVEVESPAGLVKIPIEPSEVASATERIGRPVKFRLSTED